jgi:uncharacterized protein
MPNRLINENSPYLLQHANNPVDWYPWGEEALSKARAENKPIFLSIGYAACHWCHVMEHESFEDPAIAELMNQHFVNIKVDREQRPDLDSIYMAATVAMTGQGGWPMSVFLTPDLRPFYAGTYFPPVPRYNMPSFRDLLTGIVRAWAEERAEVDKVAANVSQHLQRQNTYKDSGIILSQALLDNAVKFLHDGYDWGFGGWGGAPKFPQAMTIDYLLRRSLRPDPSPSPSPKRGGEPALHALNAMARGGMYDVVGGGFSRYSVDNHWRVPHFEKMLYDNAQLARAYLHAWQITGQPFYRRIVEETLDFVLRELSDPQGGFYASLDADSEGVEGKFYVWDANEIEQTLGADWDFFKAAYAISAAGNWEGRTVLQRALDDSTLAARFALTEDGVAVKLAECHRKLLAVRDKRIRPGLDDKVLTGWNGLMLSAFAEAARAFNGTQPGENYRRAATRNADFLLSQMRPEGRLCRTWRAGKTSTEVFLEDYAALILGLLDLYETDFDNHWFSVAQELADEMMERFNDPEGGFFDTPSDGDVRADGHPPLLYRPKDLQDNATPCGNSLAVEALLRLSAFTERAEIRAKAEDSFRLVTESAIRYPTAFARWLGAADFALATVKQVAVVGDPATAETKALLAEIRSSWRPNLVAASSPLPLPENAPPLLHNRPMQSGQPTAYLCEGFVCKSPVTSPQELKKLLESA